MTVKKQIIKKYLGKTPFFLDLRKKSLLKDNIDIEKWEKNMQFLVNSSNWDLRETVHPFVNTIIEGDSFLPPVLWKKEDRNWFIAAYPDVIMYFYPTVDLELSEEENLQKRQECDPDFQKLQVYLENYKLNQTLTLIYMKDFYKKTLNREFLMSRN